MKVCKNPADSRVRQQLEFPEYEGRTEQTHRAECDINNILRRYEQTGLITHVNETVAQYGDFSEVSDYQTSLNRVMKAQESFMALPSDIRKYFDNDPAKFLDFVGDPANKEAMYELGLASAPSDDVDKGKSSSKKNSGPTAHKNEPSDGSATSEEQ